MTPYYNKLHELLSRPYISQLADIGKGTVIQEGAIVKEDCKIGSNCKIGYNVVLRERTTIGDNTIIGMLSATDPDCFIGSNVTVETGTLITTDCKIDDWVFIGPHVTTTNTPKIKHGREYDLKIKGCHIEYGARIGAAVTIMPGIAIGKEALIGAGSLVIKDVPSYQIWFGTPAKYYRDVPADERLPLNPKYNALRGYLNG